MHVRCPHCQNPIEVVEDTPLTDMSCPACGSNFSLVHDETESFQEEDLQTLGHFELTSRLGAGHFGTVWMARDTELDRTVAVKVPRKEQLDATGVEQFLREARAAAQLNHPNIVSVHEASRDGDTLYIVSEFVRGVTLADWLTGHRPNQSEAAELCAKIADGLDHAHEAGVIHRDLKPSNIMLDADAEGEPRIMDFGLAKREAGEITMTMEGKILGTPAYMSPEQAKGESHHADRRSDVYSLGVILFELLTGERPFRGNKRMLLHQVIHDDAPSPRRLNSAIARDLETTCLKCLEKKPESRYQKAADLADELRRWLDGHPIHARPVTKPERALRWAKRNPVVASLSAAIVTLIVLVVVAAPVVAIREATLRRRADGEAKRAGQETERAGKEARLATIAAEKEALASKSARESERSLRGQLYLADMQNAVEAKGQQNVTRVRELLERYIPEDGQEDLRGFEWYHLWWYSHQHARSLPHGMSIGSVAMTPDGTVAATGDSNSEAKLWDLASGKRLATIPSFLTSWGMGPIALSPDAENLIVGSGDPLDDRLRVWDWANEKLRYAIRGMPGQSGTFGCSPDGRFLAVGAGTREISLYRLADGTLLKRFEAMHRVRLLVFSPDSESLVVSSTNGVDILAVESGTPTLRLSGHKAKVTQAAYSSDGQIIATGDASGTLKLCNGVSGAEMATLLGHEDEITGLAFGDNDKTLYSASQDNTILVWDVDTGRQRMAVCAHGQPISSMASSKSGDILLTGSGEFSAKVWSPSAFRIDQIQTGRTATFQPIAFTMDSRRLIVAGRDNRLETWDLTDGRRVVSLDRQHQEVRCLAMSPDGESFASGGADGRVILWKLSSTVPQRTTGRLGVPVDSIAFYPDGSRLAIGLSRSRLIVWNVRDWTEAFSDRAFIGSLSVSHDGQRVFAAIGNNFSWMWHGETGADLGQLTSMRSPHLAVSASPVDDKVVTAGVGGRMIVRDLARKSRVYLKGHTKPIQSVAFSPDGRVIASASDDGSVRLWDAESGRQRVSLSCDAPLRQVAFSPDGKVLAASTQDGVIRLFHTATEHDVAGLMEQEDSSDEYPPDLAINLTLQAEHAKAPNAIHYCSEALGILLSFVKESGSRFAYYKMLRCYRLRAGAYSRMGQTQEAASDLQAYLEIYDQLGDVDDVMGSFESVARIMNSIAWGMATRPSATPDEGRTAIRYAEQACEITEWSDWTFLDTLAVCYAAAGEFESAIERQKKTLELAPPEDRAECEARLALYEQGKPYIEREPESTSQAEEPDEQSEARRSNDPDEPPELAALANRIALADLYVEGGWHAEAEKLLTEAFLSEAIETTERFSDTHTNKAVLAKLHRTLAGSLKKSGKETEAVAAYRTAITLQENLIASFPGTKQHRDDLASSYDALLGMLKAAGQMEEALQISRDYVETAERLVAATPDEPGIDEILGTSCHRLGDVLFFEMRRYEEAEESYRRAVPIREKLAADFPQTRSYRQELAWSYLNLGKAINSLGRFDEAEKLYRKAVTIGEQLVAESPETPGFRVSLALQFDALGHSLRTMQRPQEAIEAHRKAAEIREKLVAQSPGNPQYQGQLAYNYHFVGVVLNQTGQPEEGEKALRKACELAEHLATEFPADPEYRHALAGSLSHLARLLQSAGESEQAEEAHLKGIELAEKLVTEDPVTSKYRKVLAEHYQGLGQLFKAIGRVGEAEETFRKAIEFWSELVNDIPESQYYRHQLIVAYDSLREVLDAQGRKPEGLEALCKAIEIREKVAADFPKDHGTRQGLAWHSRVLGLRLNESGQKARAVEAIRRSVELFQGLATESPGNAQYQSGIANGCRSLGDVLKQTDRAAEAEEAYRKAIQLQEGLVRDFPDESGYRTQLAGSYNIVAWLLATTEDPDLRDPGQAVELAKKAIDSVPDSADFWNTLGTAHYRASNWKEAREALEKATELKSGEFCYGWFFLAMLDWRQDNKEEARDWYDKAVAGMEENNPDVEELRRFREEASTLLGIADEKTAD